LSYLGEVYLKVNGLDLSR